ncbi:MAG0110 family membrane protein [Mycoplasmopsis pullorum]|uniref:Inhibitor of apoptosis-promoting Bax1 n=1 Tax=Mycoplasmopsis pullorum TaxID=48003 RepID=A0A1L4FRE4_9BACT|nr:hypothetical protein [Mycoplasmopsis pullorum]APJ38174.1 hypothetical protein BLA55_00515 [Mycoplasmopsis pullorum]
MNEFLHQEQRISITNGRKTFYALVSLFFGIAFTILIATMGIASYFVSPRWLMQPAGIGTSFGIFISGLIFLVVFSYYGNRMNLFWKIVSSIVIVFFLSYFVVYATKVWLEFDSNRTLIIFGSLLIPGIIMIAAGLLGYFEIIKIEKLTFIYWILFAVYIVTTIVVFVTIFVTSNSKTLLTMSNFYSFLIITIVFVSTAIDFYLLRKKAESFETTVDKKELVKEALMFSVSLFSNYVQLVLQILRLFSFNKN